MKIKDKMYIVMIFFFIILALSISIFGIKAAAEHKENINLLEDEMIHNCEVLDKNAATSEQLEVCERIESVDYNKYNPTAFETYESYILEFVRKYCGEFIIIFIILLGSIFYMSKYLRNRIILNDLTRESYRTIKKKLFLSSWKYSLLLPLMFIIIFIFVIIFIGNVGISESDRITYSLANTMFDNNVLVYFVVLLINSFILTLLYSNIGLIVSRKEHNYILAVIKSYLLIIAIELFFEIVLYHIIYKLFGSSCGVYLNILTIYNYTYVDKNLLTIFILLCLLVISFVILYFCYRNKEKLIIDVEKNDNKEEV